MRMAARLSAIVVPFAAVGGDDAYEVHSSSPIQKSS